MRWLGMLWVLGSVAAIGQVADAVSAGTGPTFVPATPQSVGAKAVSAVLANYARNPMAQVPETQQPLAKTGTWGMHAGRPEACPKDDTPCVGVVYTVAETKVVCEWTVVPPEGAKAASFLNQNAAASRYFLRELTPAEVKPLVAKSAAPVYPPIARAAHVSGAVEVRVVVNAAGAVEMAAVVSGPEMLRASALDAAKKWSFRPMEVGTQATGFTAVLNGTFSLKEDPKNCVKTNNGTFCSALPVGGAVMQP